MTNSNVCLRALLRRNPSCECRRMAKFQSRWLPSMERFNTAATGICRTGNWMNSRDAVSFRSHPFSSSSGGPSDTNTPTGANQSNSKSSNTTNQSSSNFDRRLLQPALRGELVGKHDSGIPRLAARKQKAHLMPETRRPPTSALDLVEEAEFRGGGGSSSSSTGGRPPNRDAVFEAISQQGYNYGQNDNGDDADQFDDISMEAYVEIFARVLKNDPIYYWKEETYDAFDTDMTASTGDELVFIPSVQAGNVLALEDTTTSTTTTDSDDVNDVGDTVDVPDTRDEVTVTPRRTLRESEASNNLPSSPANTFTEWFRKQHDILEFANNPLFAAGKEPTEPEEKLVDLHVYENPHPDSTREPKPILPRNRRRPTVAFLNRYRRFLYVFGLPTVEVVGMPADLDNPVDYALVQKAMAHAVDVSMEQCFPATASSGYIGFDSILEVAETLMIGPVDDSVVTVSPPVFLPFAEKEHAFAKVSPESTLLLDNIERGHTSISLARVLFPPDTEVGDAYGNITADHISFLTKSSALIRFASREQATSVLDSHLVRSRLEELGRYKIRLVRARRDLVHAGLTHGKEQRKLGQRLLVDGDMPTRPFYIAHAGMLRIGNLDPTVSKAELSQLVQPYCATQRDVHSSIEIVTCQEDLPMGQAYVGFDLPGEAEAAVAGLGSKRKLGDRPAFISLVIDRRVPNRVYVGPERRPDRDVDALLCDLNDWEQYVNQADIQLLQEAGISKHVLNDALRVIRYNNASFGALDYSIRAEALEPEKSAGQQYKELVQLYIETLKECLATPEEPGFMYEALHFPDEEIDTSIFEAERERQETIQRERSHA